MLYLLLLTGTILSACGDDQSRGLVLPIGGMSLATLDDLHNALAPAWDSMVDQRNNAGLVGAKDEGKPQPPMSKEETAFQYERVQKGEVDSARLLLVFGLVPGASYMDNETIAVFAEERDKEQKQTDGQTEPDTQSNLPAVLDPHLKYPDGSTPLHMAAAFGLAGSARGLLDAGADVNAVTRSGVQPIHSAAILGHVAILDVLANKSASVDARHTFVGSTPLHFAAEMGHPEVVRRLCELRADVEAEKRQGGTAVHISADTNNAAVARVLIEEPCGADPEAVLLGDTVPLYLAAGRGFHKVIDVLLEAGANPDRTLWPERPWQKKKNKKKQQKATSQELQVAGNPAHHLPGSDPNAPGWEVGNGATALHNACENGHLLAAMALLDGGARQLNTMEGVTPLIISLQYKHRHIAAALLDHKTPAGIPVASPKDGQTALHIAAAYDYSEVVARILREGGSTDVRDRRGNSPVDYARGQVTRWLLTRFQGRDPKLDAMLRAQRNDNGEQDFTRLEDDIRAKATDAAPEVKDIYLEYIRQHSQGTLADEASRLAQTLKQPGNDGEWSGNMRRFSIARLILAGGSDAPTAVEAMMQKTEASMHAGLALLGIPVEHLDYKPGKRLKVNGRDVLLQVDRTVKAAIDSSQHGNAEAFEFALEDLKAFVAGRETKRQESPDDSTESSSTKLESEATQDATTSGAQEIQAGEHEEDDVLEL